jgi:flagellar basal body-associated protein FliL
MLAKAILFKYVVVVLVIVVLVIVVAVIVVVVVVFQSFEVLQSCYFCAMTLNNNNAQVTPKCQQLHKHNDMHYDKSKFPLWCRP